MDKAILEKLKAAGFNDAEIAALNPAPVDDSRIAALEARLEAEVGKAGGILGDKKKAQEKAAELQAKIDEFESKGLGEVDKLKLDMERLQSKYDQESTQRAELETTYNAEKRGNALTKIGGQLKWMDTVPENLRTMTLKNEFDGIDLGNEVLVTDKLKTITETYAGLLASNVPSGAGSRSGVNQTNQNSSFKQVQSTPLKDISKDPLAYIMAAAEANANQ